MVLLHSAAHGVVQPAAHISGELQRVLEVVAAGGLVGKERGEHKAAVLFLITEAEEADDAMRERIVRLERQLVAIRGSKIRLWIAGSREAGIRQDRAPGCRVAICAADCDLLAVVIT